MKILRIVAEGFRGLADGEYVLAPGEPPTRVVVVEGPPASGKTSLLQAIALVKELVGAYGPLPAAERVVRSGAKAARLEATWLLEVQQGLDAIRRWEASSGRQLNGFFALDFVSPFNHLLGRAAPLHVALGIDTERTNPRVTAEMLEALRDIDAIMRPKCPVEVKRAAIWKQFAQALEERELIALSPCWDMYLRK